MAIAGELGASSFRRRTASSISCMRVAWCWLFWPNHITHGLSRWKADCPCCREGKHVIYLQSCCKYGRCDTIDGCKRWRRNKSHILARRKANCILLRARQSYALSDCHRQRGRIRQARVVTFKHDRFVTGPLARQSNNRFCPGGLLWQSLADRAAASSWMEFFCRQLGWDKCTPANDRAFLYGIAAGSLPRRQEYGRRNGGSRNRSEDCNLLYNQSGPSRAHLSPSRSERSKSQAPYFCLPELPTGWKYPLHGC